MKSQRRMFHGPRDRVLFWPFVSFFSFFLFPPHFLQVVTMAFVHVSWKAQGYEHFPGTFYWERQTKMAGLLRAASTLSWRVGAIRWGFENNDANKGTEQVGFNEIPPSRKHIPLCSSFSLLGSSVQRRPEKSQLLSRRRCSVFCKQSCRQKGGLRRAEKRNK